MSRDKDLRDLTRAINSLHDVIEALNNNLVAVGNRIPKVEVESEESSVVRKLVYLCAVCSDNKKCYHGAPFYSGECACCNRGHDIPK